MLVQHPHSVTIVAVEDGQVLVVVQPRPGAGGPTVELPAGCLEPGEAPREAAERELREECSLRAERWREIGSFWAAPSYATEYVHVFEARGLHPQAGTPDDDEHIAVQRRALAELPAALSDATSIAAFALWASSCAR
ncbi:MAG TPA: NUDIX hydrolase [Solirubrobacteraceae bacterium]|nr:NUDIX hydrolase [Solirubrobacteraceae bacterium]